MSYARYRLSLKKHPINTDWKFISNIKEVEKRIPFVHIQFSFVPLQNLFLCISLLYIRHPKQCRCRSFLAALELLLIFEHPTNSKTLYVCLCVPLIPTYSRLIALAFRNSPRNCKMLSLKWRILAAILFDYPCLNAVSRLSLSLLSTVVRSVFFFAFIPT